MRRALPPLVICCLFATTAASASAQQAASSPFGPGGPLQPWRNPVPQASQPAPLTSSPQPIRSNAPPCPPNQSGSRYDMDAPAIMAEAHLGLGTPLGNAGVALDLAPVSLFAINVGIGKSLDGTQFAVTPRLRFRFWEPELMVGLGVGYSTGPYRWDNDRHGLFAEPMDDAAYRSWAHAGWTNFELSLEARAMPVGLRGYLGYALLQTRDSDTCTTPNSSQSDGCDITRDKAIGVVYAGFALAFGATL